MNQPMKYRKKPVTIEAMQVTTNNRQDVISWILDGGADVHIEHAYIIKVQGLEETYAFEVKTLEGFMTAKYGDFIIKGVQGEFYPCREDIFEQTYEEAK